MLQGDRVSLIEKLACADSAAYIVKIQLRVRKKTEKLYTRMKSISFGPSRVYEAKQQQ